MILLHPTTPDEASLLYCIQKDAFLPLYERYHDSGNPCLRDKQDILMRLQSPRFRYFTILWNDEIAGGIFYRTEGATPFYDALPPHEYYLQRIYIKPELQGKHIAQEAILLCEKWFPDAVCFHVDFPEDLDKNRRCYEGAGFNDTDKRLQIEENLTLAAYAKYI